jgi:hypothetical protein
MITFSTLASGGTFMARKALTLGNTYWMNQSKLIAGRRADLASPLVFPAQSKALQQWRNAHGFDVDAWSAYKQ